MGPGLGLGWSDNPCPPSHAPPLPALHGPDISLIRKQGHPHDGKQEAGVYVVTEGRTAGNDFAMLN